VWSTTTWPGAIAAGSHEQWHEQWHEQGRMNTLARSRSRAAGWPSVSSLPVWAQVLGVYAAARFVTFLITVGVARFQVENVWTGARPAYLDFVRIWDGEWYHRIVGSG
jgi:hypothetical protein